MKVLEYRYGTDSYTLVECLLKRTVFYPFHGVDCFT